MSAIDNVYIDEPIKTEGEIVQLLFTVRALENLITLFNNNNVRDKNGYKVTIEPPKYERFIGAEYQMKCTLTSTLTYDVVECLSR